MLLKIKANPTYNTSEKSLLVDLMKRLFVL